MEAPGTAPGSDRFITQAVYRHSRLPDTHNIGPKADELKGAISDVYFASVLTVLFCLEPLRVWITS